MRKKKTEETPKNRDNPNVLGLRGETSEQAITDTLEQNYMPYAMSVIVSRAIPEIDGFKPSHRKLLYTMYKMGLLSGARTKSANIVGQTMRLNPHGDAAIYETMVRLSAGNQSLLTPFVDSKGNFGKVYSRDMAYAASRYTEAKLAKICTTVFDDIDKDAVDFVDNYDGSMKEPVLLPTAFPNVLVSANSGIAVGMASQICGFNLNEVCSAAIALLRDGEADLLSLMPAPDFPTGGEILYDRAAMEAVYRTGRGSIPIRARWRYLQKENLIEITEIPYTTTCEAILDKVAELIKAGKIREINDMRDETDLNGLRLAIDLKRGTDPEKLMQKLFHSTTLQDSFPCNFNILIAGNPRVMGVQEILEEWIACIRSAQFMITDSFHGMCLAILFQKPFVAIANAARGNTRFHEILGKLGLSERVVSSLDEIADKQDLLDRLIDYKAVNSLLEKERSDSFRWLDNALIPKKPLKSLSDFDILAPVTCGLKTENQKQWGQLEDHKLRLNGIDDRLNNQDVTNTKQWGQLEDHKLRLDGVDDKINILQQEYKKVSDLCSHLKEQNNQLEEQNNLLKCRIADLENTVSGMLAHPLKYFMNSRHSDKKTSD